MWLKYKKDSNLTNVVKVQWMALNDALWWMDWLSWQAEDISPLIDWLIDLESTNIPPKDTTLHPVVERRRAEWGLIIISMSSSLSVSLCLAAAASSSSSSSLLTYQSNKTRTRFLVETCLTRYTERHNRLPACPAVSPTWMVTDDDDEDGDERGWRRWCWW